ncbi:Pentatricopeptide repeat-containing protein [Thalictrum thalictroides]|uniref:Pentatricopeptide repeat-containing protein n=1 Tax=Thalictrum thalictroides TaxID=46969 RepID=A0A7J6VFE2_THATH|nr:Pentatricopeptide repeat-containing protein [Thalictrum thalictroides]
MLEDTGVRITTEDVEEVLKLSYGYPATAVKFFRWAGRQLNDNHSPYGWNLVVDLLGKNLLFEAMWDAIKSMKKEGLLSLATFASVFSSYAVNDRVDEAIMTFEVMDQYGCPRDVVALNSLLSAICRDGKTAKAREFFNIAKDKIRPDGDTYAILLEGWETEGDPINAHKTFGEMVIQLGWDPVNVPAYDAFLNTILKGRDGVNESMKFFAVLKTNRCFPGMKFFRSALNEFITSNRAREACELWEGMVRINGCIPDTQMYNNMITLQCYVNKSDLACQFMDEMVFYGAFPDSNTYNVMLRFLLKMRKMREVSTLFNEMLKNEFVPSQENCTSAITVFVDVGDPEMAIKVWKCMLGNEMKNGLEITVNLFIMGLRDLNRLSEARKYAEDAIERGIKLSSSTLSKLKQSFTQLGKAYVYEQLLKKWKSKSH